nr:transposase [Bifidobacterium bifidum]
MRRAQKPRRLGRAPIHGPRHARRRGSQGPALPLLAAQGTPAHAPAPAAGQAEGELKRWINWASHSRIPEIVELCRKIRRCRDDILRTIRPGHSNARLEAFNNRIKVTIRMAYGFHHVDNLIAMINSDAPAYPSDCRSPSSNPRKQQKPHFFIASTCSSTDMDAV